MSLFLGLRGIRFVLPSFWASPQYAVDPLKPKPITLRGDFILTRLNSLCSEFAPRYIACPFSVSANVMLYCFSFASMPPILVILSLPPLRLTEDLPSS